MVYWGAVSSGIEEQAVCPASAVRGFREGSEGSGAVGLGGDSAALFGD